MKTVSNTNIDYFVKFQNLHLPVVLSRIQTDKQLFREIEKYEQDGNSGKIEWIIKKCQP